MLFDAGRSTRRPIQTAHSTANSMASEFLGANMKRHSHYEIKRKLIQADELARAGNSQEEICKALGVSVMTLYRWRKLPLGNDEAQSSDGREASADAPASVPSMDEMRRELEDLAVENQRLRKLVTDLMLEKMSLEEASSTTVRAGRVRKA
jgi:putative transposase